MKITEIYKQNISAGRLTLTGEVEPPTRGRGREPLWNRLDPIINYLDYVTVTYHPEKRIRKNRGQWITTTLKPGTPFVVAAMQKRYEGGIFVPHIICSSFTASETQDLLLGLGYIDIDNVIALRGDPPKGPDGRFMRFRSMPGGHAHASELVQQISDLREGKYLHDVTGMAVDFCVGGACYPEKHSNSPSWKHEMKWLKHKVNAGTHILYTQAFFDAELYPRLLDRCTESGITIPIIPGIQIISKDTHVTRFPDFFNCSIPRELREKVLSYEQPQDIAKAGLEWSIQQCEKVIGYGAPGLHLYGITRGAPAKEFLEYFRSSQ